MLAALAVVLAALLVPFGPPPPTVATAPGTIELSIAPDELAPATNSATLLLSNSGDGPVRDLAVEIDAPAGVDVKVEPEAIALLAPRTSTLLTLTIAGQPALRPATLVVRASGATDAGPAAALATIALIQAAAPVSLALAGNTRMTESSPADLQAVVANLTDAPLAVTLRAEAGAHQARLAVVEEQAADARPANPVSLTVAPRGTAIVFVRVDADGVVRRGKIAVVVTASVTAEGLPAPVEVAASRELDTALSSADLLPGPLGVGALAVPGLAGVATWLAVGRWDRRRLGLTPPGVAAQIWDNKLWFLAVAAVSLAAVVVYDGLGGVDMLDSYDWQDLLIASVGAAAAGFGAAQGRVWLYRRRVPLITAGSDPLVVLRAAARTDSSLRRLTFTVSDTATGLLVHHDRDAVVLAPRVGCSRPDSVVNAPDLAAAVEAAGAGDFDGHWWPTAGQVDAPVAVSGAAARGRSEQAIVEYHDR